MGTQRLDFAEFYRRSKDECLFTVLVGIPLLPLAQGYYFTADNAADAARRYEDWQM